MARQLWLLRHAEAEPHGTRADFERRLTEKGERQARTAGLALARMGVELGTVLSSPKERALRTATIAMGAWDERCDGASRHGELTIDTQLQQGFAAPHALAVIAEAGPDGRVLVVGHEPDFSTVVAELTGARVDLKKAGLAVLRLLPGAEREQPTTDSLAGIAASTAVAASGEGETAHAAARRRSEPAGELVLLLRPAELMLIAGVELTGS